jgi:pyruvate dehydrogenase (quinone)
MAPKVSDLILDQLVDWDVDTIFGLPGDGINGFMEALRKRQSASGRTWTKRTSRGARSLRVREVTGRLGV